MYFNFQFYHLLTSQIQSSLKMKDRLKRSYLTFGLVIGMVGWVLHFYFYLRLINCFNLGFEILKSSKHYTYLP